MSPDRKQALGLYGALIIAPRDRTTAPAKANNGVHCATAGMAQAGLLICPAMLMEGRRHNLFTINGKVSLSELYIG